MSIEKSTFLVQVDAFYYNLNLFFFNGYTIITDRFLPIM